MGLKVWNWLRVWCLQFWGGS